MSANQDQINAIKNVLGNSKAAKDYDDNENENDCELFEVSEILNAIFNWHLNDLSPDGFDIRFIRSIETHYNKYGRISMKQWAALKNIVTSFNIQIERWA